MEGAHQHFLLVEGSGLRQLETEHHKVEQSDVAGPASGSAGADQQSDSDAEVEQGPVLLVLVLESSGLSVGVGQRALLDSLDEVLSGEVLLSDAWVIVLFELDDSVVDQRDGEVEGDE
jgi:hypothetical protein